MPESLDASSSPYAVVVLSSFSHPHLKQVYCPGHLYPLLAPHSLIPCLPYALRSNKARITFLHHGQPLTGAESPCSTSSAQYPHGGRRCRTPICAYPPSPNLAIWGGLCSDKLCNY